MTKETHLCHCLALTSDSLFVEYVYNRAELQERAKYIKVDDFSREDALNYLELNGLGEYKEEIISKVGCKPSLLSIVVNESKIAEVNDKNMKDILCDMIKDQKQKIQSTLELLRYITPKVKWEDEVLGVEREKIIELLFKFKDNNEIQDLGLNLPAKKYLIDKNLIFLDQSTGILKPQSKLVKRAIEDISEENFKI
ncbi:MAG: ATP-binding protein [Methanosarcinales archaeon]